MITANCRLLGSLESRPRRVSSRIRMLSSNGIDEGPSLMKTVEKVRTKLGKNDGSWEDLWREGTTPWDLGKPTPLLIQELEKIRVDTARRMRSLVPGCGSGYDLLSLVAHHEATIEKTSESIESLVLGLDISSHALKSAERVVSNGKKSLTTRLELKCGDFFEDPREWKTTYCASSGDIACPTQFDFIFDYTFFVALPPLLRASWGRQMAKILDPQNGQLLTIMFPILPGADPNLGPPYPVSVEDYANALAPHGIVMSGKPFQSHLSVPSRAGKELICYWRFQN